MQMLHFYQIAALLRGTRRIAPIGSFFNGNLHFWSGTFCQNFMDVFGWSVISQLFNVLARMEENAARKRFSPTAFPMRREYFGMMNGSITFSIFSCFIAFFETGKVLRRPEFDFGTRAFFSVLISCTTTIRFVRIRREFPVVNVDESTPLSFFYLAIALTATGRSIFEQISITKADVKLYMSQSCGYVKRQRKYARARCVASASKLLCRNHTDAAANVPSSILSLLTHAISLSRLLRRLYC